MHYHITSCQYSQQCPVTHYFLIDETCVKFYIVFWQTTMVSTKKTWSFLMANRLASYQLFELLSPIYTLH